MNAIPADSRPSRHPAAPDIANVFSRGVHAASWPSAHLAAWTPRLNTCGKSSANLPWLVLGLLLFAGPVARGAGGDADYTLSDPQLRLTRIDSDPTESFLAVRPDGAGRLFVGSRSGLFVYDPDGKGGFGPRQLLYRFANHTWVYDIAVRGDDVYASTVSAIYLFPGAATRRDALKPKRLIFGIPMGHIHQCIHDMAWGPQGDLYFTAGDPSPTYGDFNRADHFTHWTWFCQPEGTKVPYSGVGAVYRCRPDGSHLQVVARGLRNAVGLAFDDQWNLFTADNDHEQIPAEYVPGRLLHVEPHCDFMWPRGWMPQNQPNRADLLETMNPDLGRFVPVGMAFYGDELIKGYAGSLLLDRWGTHCLPRYPLVHRGASFSAAEVDLLTGKGDARPVGVAVDRAGRVFVTVCYMPANDTSPTYKSDIIMLTAGDAAAPVLGDITTLSSRELSAELGNANWSRRSAAHEEILRRGGEALTAAAADDPWMAAATGQADLVVSSAQRASSRLAGVRALAELPPTPESVKAFTSALSDPDPQVELAAIQGLFSQQGELPPQVAAGPALSSDTYLRQAATKLLALRGSMDQLTALCTASDVRARLAGVLAAGFRLTTPPDDLPAGFKLDQPNPGSFILNLADGRVNLKKLGPVGNFTMADLWRQVPHSPEQEGLFALLVNRLRDADPSVRWEAAYFLRLLNDPRSEPTIAQIRQQFPPAKNLQQTQITEIWLLGPLPRDVRVGGEGPINLAAQYPAGQTTASWQRLSADGGHFAFDKLPGLQKSSSVYAYLRIDSATAQPAMLLADYRGNGEAWLNGSVLPTTSEIWNNVRMNLQVGTSDLLLRFDVGDAAKPIAMRIESAAALNLSLPDAVDSARLAQRLAEAQHQPDSTVVPPEFVKIDWETEWQKGNAVNGKKLFTSLACGTCHAIEKGAAGGGAPSLAEARKRFTVQYVVESILLPNKVVAPLFRWTVIRTRDGQIFNGLVVGETADEIQMRLTDASLHVIPRSQVTARRVEDHSPMPQGLVRTPQELRDLLAYILGK
jgi:putative heme-binding domain-containing protein